MFLVICMSPATLDLKLKLTATTSEANICKRSPKP